MILQKLASAIRRQDWFQVVIEVLIVIVGIFLGLQVTEWNQQRINRDIEKDYLERIHSDLQINQRRITSFIMVGERKLENLGQIRSAIDNKSIVGQSPDEFFKVLSDSTSFGWQIPQIQRETFDELLGSQHLTLVRNTELRNQIARYYYFSATRRDRMQTRVTDYAPTLFKLVDSRTGIAYDYDERVVPSYFTQLSDIEKNKILANFLSESNNKNFHELINAEENFSIFLSQQYVEQLEMIEDLLSIIEQELNSGAAP